MVVELVGIGEVPVIVPALGREMMVTVAGEEVLDPFPGQVVTTLYVSEAEITGVVKVALVAPEMLPSELYHWYCRPASEDPPVTASSALPLPQKDGSVATAVPAAGVLVQVVVVVTTPFMAISFTWKVPDDAVGAYGYTAK